MVAATALVQALSFAMAGATTLPSTPSSLDLGSQVMLRLFGETSDATASFAAAQGDRASESPLRDLALHVPPAGATSPFAGGNAVAFEQDRLTLRDLAGASGGAAFSPTTGRGDIVQFVSPSALFAAAYQAVAPAPSISPLPGTLAFAPPTATLDEGANVPGDAHASSFVPTTSQIGPVRFETHTDSSAVQTPQLDLSDSSYGAGANFEVRAGKRNLDLNLSGGYDRVTGGGADAFSATTLNAASWQVPGGVPLVLPNGADLSRLSLGAGVAVPVVRGLTLNLDYAAARLYNGYGLPGLVNLDTVNNSYGGRLTFDIPSTSSSLSISAYQDRFNDSLLPINGSTQTREDVNFTVKF